MSQTQFVRRGKVIYPFDAVKRTIPLDDKGDRKILFVGKSFNQTKRKSRDLQMKTDGAIGLGCLRIGDW